MTSVKVDSENFETEVLFATGPVVVDFWAEWCRPCKMISPALEQIAKELVGKVKIAKVNVDDSPALAAKYGVRAIPTLAIFKNGEVSDLKVGAFPKSSLSAWIEASVA
jgi:thioredoxin 1